MAALTQDSLFTSPNTIRCARLGCGRLVDRTLSYGVFCSPDCYVAQHRPKARKPARTSRPRDSQRSKVYKAERKAFPLMLKQEFDSLADCQEWLDTLLDEWWLKSRWGKRRVPIRAKRSGNAWASFDGTMALPKWAWNRWVIIHELAHVLNGITVAGHGPEYCAIYLELVRGHLGQEDAGKLREAFAEGGVKYRAGVAAVPKAGTRKVVTKAEEAARKKAANERPVTRQEARQAAEVLRRAVRLGHLGKAGTKLREGALTAARTLEGFAS